MQFLNDFSLKAKISILLLIPIIGLLWFCSMNLLDRRELSAKTSQITTLNELGVRISLLLHETQEERGMTAGFLGSSGRNFASELPQQRAKNTDPRAQELHLFLKSFNIADYDAELAAILDNAMGELRVVGDYRRQVDQQSIATGKVISYYSSMNKLFIESVDRIPLLVQNFAMSSLMTAYSNYIQIKELAALERAVMTNTFARDRFGVGMLSKFNLLVTDQKIHNNKFFSYAAPEDRAFAQKQLKGPIVDELDEMRNIAFNKGERGGFGVDPNIWYTTSSSWLKLLKEVEDHLSKGLITRADRLHKNANKEYENFLILTIVAFTATLFLLVILIKEIKNSNVQGNVEVKKERNIPVVEEAANSLDTTSKGVEHIALDSAVVPTHLTQAIDSPDMSGESFVTNKVAANSSDTPDNPIFYAMHKPPTAESRITRLVSLVTATDLDIEKHREEIGQGVKDGHNFFL
ncbi:MAG: nitrate- and nitrite sensing domain-containing protein, partial [Magnetococcales bacterium]|nr:nitrate- and nitrite sensing domain-containing protein [Magnetococcales bacterium]